MTESYLFWHVRICCCRPVCSPELPIRSSINQHFGSSTEDAGAERAARGTCSWAPWGYPVADVGWNFPGSRGTHQAAAASPKLLVLGVGCGTGSSRTYSWTHRSHGPLATACQCHQSLANVVRLLKLPPKIKTRQWLTGKGFSLSLMSHMEENLLNNLSAG